MWRAASFGARSRGTGRLISERGAPKFLRSDNGPEFVSTRLLQWAADEGLQMALSQPGKPCGSMVPMRVSPASFATSACRWNASGTARKLVS